MRAHPAVLAARRPARRCACSTPAAAPARSRSRRRGAAPRWSRSTVADAGRPRARAQRRRPGRGRIDFRVGDMLDPALGRFDHVVAMDSLIHYAPPTMRCARWPAWPRAPTARCCSPSRRARRLLAAMHAVGRLFPRGDRAPAIVPVAEATLRRLVGASRPRRLAVRRATQRVVSGFYTSQALELVARDERASNAPSCRGWSRLGAALPALRRRGHAPSCRSAGCCACRCSRSRSAWRRCC